MTRRRDRLTAELIGSGSGAKVFDLFTALHLTLDMTMPSEASFEVGDERTWDELAEYVKHGRRYAIRLNGRPLLEGRIEMNDVPFDSSGGATVRFVIRTKLSDAMFASADPLIQVKQDTSLRTFLLALYEPLGYTESDFVGLQAASRNIVTGKAARGSRLPEIKFDRLQLKEARISPPETIFGAADRHLRRFGLMHWDSPDGKIVIGKPDDFQKESFVFNSYRTSPSRTRSDANNVTSATRGQDWSGVPSYLDVYGRGTSRSFSRTGVQGAVADNEVFAAGFHRPVYIFAEGIRSPEAATKAAYREMSARRRNKDVLNVEVDGFSFWDGYRQINYYVDSVARLRTDVAGGDLGTYYIHRVEMTRDAAAGDVTRLTMLKSGLWVLSPDEAGTQT